MIRLRPILNKRFYVLFIIKHKTREIVQFAVIMYPVREFVKQQIMDLTEDLNEIIYLIHDRTGEFWLNYIDYGIKEIKTSVKAPNMLLSAPCGVNAIAERWIGSVRREILDYFIIFSKKQLRNILEVYIDYYNKTRPHQGLNQRIPKGYKINDGKIKSRSILFGLNHEYYREAA